jgi:hypothetical protein
MHTFMKNNEHPKIHIYIATYARFLVMDDEGNIRKYLLITNHGGKL